MQSRQNPPQSSGAALAAMIVTLLQWQHVNVDSVTTPVGDVHSAAP